MDTYSSCKGSALKEPFNSEAAAKGKKKTSTRITVRISVEGFNPLRPEDEIKSELINHFESCGDIIRVDVPTDPFYDSDIGDWNALVKLAPEEEEEEYKAAVAYKKSLCADLANDKRFLFGIAVLGYDTSLPQDEVESILREHFSSCGEITHVYVDTLDKCTNIYFSKEEGEASALDLNGSKVGGFKITTMRVATVRSNRRSGPGTVGSCIPAHFLEFSRENTKKLEDYMTEWRAKARREKDSALRKHNTFKASKRARG
ncbi:hypothetical protein HID58_062572 [Brassica napus]|uniref:RRM domain-containing protein n=1 Tax=Brassica napus TaxID=3708 RepID=A0ABQ8A2T1_BRANA|nr:hypothetical protein HID58_062572 [Brassica napus]